MGPPPEGRMAMAIAIDFDKSSQEAVKWACGNILSKGERKCILIHVTTVDNQACKCSSLPKGGPATEENKLRRLFLPMRGLCARKGIDAKEVVLYDLDVANALIDYMKNNAIDHIVVGSSNRSAIARKLRPPDVPTTLIKSAPDFCTVYIIAKTKIQKVRHASRNVASILIQQPHEQLPSTPNCKLFSKSSSRGSWKSLGDERYFDKNHSLRKSSTIKNGSNNSSPPRSASHFSVAVHKPLNLDSSSDISFTGPLSFRSTGEYSDKFDFSSMSDNSASSDSSIVQNEIKDEMRSLKLKLNQFMDTYNNAKQRERQYQQQKMAEVYMYAEDPSLGLAGIEKPENKNSMEEAQLARCFLEIEAKKKRNMETKAQASEKKGIAGKASAKNRITMYRQYTITDIEVATDYFSLKIGEGGYGPVFKGSIDYTPVAIKILRPDAAQGKKQFEQEVQVLSYMRHPHMVLLLGACPDYGCLVYEYMDNGSLEELLFRKNNTPPIPWQSRFRIATEIATALLFLHEMKPEPLVHRDLKPGNILLDRNYVSKISDVGLARLVPSSVANDITNYCMTAAAGTFCYIDPEYLQTGILGVKSDIYSLGVMYLQMITAMPPIGLSHKVEKAIERGTFLEILDQSLTDWPLERALSFANLALKCCELRKKDRPDLASVILPELQRLGDL